ncbi:MAG: hypothetical protein SOZ27_01830, partial [Spirochaetia bacterium]|nr:hypothetical protein [Spirochaetia bacterium]
KQLEVLTTDAPEGTPVLPHGTAQTETPKEIKIDRFFEIPITVRDFSVEVAGVCLTAGDRLLRTDTIRNGNVG